MKAFIGLIAAGMFLFLDPATAQTRRYALASTDGLQLLNVTAEPTTLHGRKGVRVTSRALAPLGSVASLDQLASIENLEFSNGVIEAEMAGSPGLGTPEEARGFVGIAFRVQADMKTYDAFFLRPTNGRADDQERRNHSAQYISHPDWPWSRLRRETPARYETYVDLEPGVWTRVKIEVRGARARLFVHGHEQPALVVNDVKSGARARGAIALWIGPGTVAHFRDLTVQPAPDEQ